MIVGAGAPGVRQSLANRSSFLAGSYHATAPP